MENATTIGGRLELDSYLEQAERVILASAESAAAPPTPVDLNGGVRVGVDLGTAYLVLVALDQEGCPLAGEYQFAQVARDGLVVDFVGAVDRLRGMKARLERRLGAPLEAGATGFPPGVAPVEVRATANVLEAAGIACSRTIDEPTAANAVLGLEEGAIVDVGGGTTGIAVIQDGSVVYTADEPTGGTHFSLVIAGALDISFEQAESLKLDPEEQLRLLPVVRPVMEKVGAIIEKHVTPFDVQEIHLVGGATAFPEFCEVVAAYTGFTVTRPARPLFVTPLGIALAN